ncbi:MAG: serine hydrolase [Bryobacteraceae bacterium]
MRAVSILLLAASQVFAASDPSLGRLERQIEFVAHATDGILGVSAIHIESGRSVSVRGGESFPMASAFKLPIAVQVMTLVDSGTVTLDKIVTLTPQDLHPGSGKISELLFHPGVALSVENLLELMLVVSDNSAADLMLREAGGPAMISAWQGAKNIPAESEWNKDMWDKLYDAVPQREHMAARRAEMADPRDTATPDDMTRLLVHVWKKDLFSARNADDLLGMMERCETGKARIKGMLPEGTPVAHKTGTLGGVANDVGVITLPGDLGHVAISVFTKSSNKPEEAAEKAVAEVSRTIYDYFVLVPAVRN